MSSDQHLDLDALADVLAGEASAEQTAHLSTCATCPAALEALAAALDRVGSDLVALPEPTPSAELAERWDSALADERSAAPAASAAPTATVTPIASRADRRTRWLTAASGVAAAAAIVVGAIVLLPGDRGGSADKGASTALTEQASLPQSSTGLNYGPDGTLLKAQVPALLTAQSAAKGTAPEVGGPVTDGSSAPRAFDTAVVDALERLRDPAALAACLTAVTEGDDDLFPLALDYAMFEEKPALVVVLPTSKPGKVDVFVVGPGCAQGDEQLLFYLRVDNP